MDYPQLQYDERFYARLRHRTAVGGAVIFLIPFLLFTVLVQFASERYVRRQTFERLEAGAAMNARLLEAQPASPLLHLGLGETEDTLVTNSAGELQSTTEPGAAQGPIFAPGQANPFTGERGTAEYRTAGGTLMLAAFEKLPGKDSYVVTQVSRAELQGPVARLRSEVMFYVLPFLLLGVVLAFFAWRYALDYIQRLMTELYQALQLARQREQERDLANRELARRFEQERELAQQKAQLQTMLAEYEKYAALAQLALGAAHEINNPLLGILSHLELDLRATQDAQRREEIEQCIEGSKRIAATLRGLINYARPGPLMLSQVSLAQMVEDAVAFLEHQPLFRNISLENRIPPGIPSILADSNQLSQVLMNLLLNAAQAMPNGGRITISAESIAGEKIQIRIEDTGTGIPEDVLPHIFEPFFTTKRGKGTGLGLSITQAYVRSHGGEIEVHTVPEKGTIVCVTMPLRQEVREELAQQEVIG